MVVAGSEPDDLEGLHRAALAVAGREIAVEQSRFDVAAGVEVGDQVELLEDEPHDVTAQCAAFVIAELGDGGAVDRQGAEAGQVE